MTRYGYIGLGMMGSAMAENLIRNTDDSVTVFDLDQAAVDKAVGLGAVAAASPAEVANNAEVVSICVPAANHIDAVMSGPDGIAEGAHADLAIVIHSTVHPDTMRDAQTTAAAWGVPLFDACVAGGDTNARAGTQLVLAGGVPDMPPKVTDLLAIYASRIIDAGPVGSGAALKIAINVMTYAQFAAATTSHDLMVSAGGDPKTLLDAWRDMGQLGTLTEQFSGLLGIPAEHVTGDFRTMLETQVGISQKDLSLALGLGETRPMLNPFLHAVHDAMPSVYNVEDPS